MTWPPPSTPTASTAERTATAWANPLTARRRRRLPDAVSGAVRGSSTTAHARQERAIDEQPPVSPERIVPLVADSDPIERNQHHRLLLIRLQDDAARCERIIYPNRRRHERIAQRRSRRRCHINLKRRDAKINRVTSERTEQKA